MIDQKYTMHTAHDDTVIIQELRNEYQERLAQWVTNTRDQSIRDALIEMGWTPPEEKK